MQLNFEPILGKINSNKTNSIDFFLFSTPFTVYNSVMRLGSDTFGNPIFQKGLQN